VPGSTRRRIRLEGRPGIADQYRIQFTFQAIVYATMAVG
jgi:hypothetical protein